MSGGKGTPGYLLQCFKKIGENGSEDKCTGTLNMTTTNTSSGVTATFSAGQKLECNTGSGALEGSQAISAGQGGKLSAVTATETAKLSEAEWRLGGATISQPLATGWEGKMTLNVTTLGIKGSVECEVDTAAGAVGIGGSGTVTSWNASKCVATAKEMICKVGESATVTAVNLPWASELVTTEGVTREVIVGGGKGTPGYLLKCSDEHEDKCTGALSMTTTNTSGGVTATFSASEKLECNTGNGTLEGS